MSVSFKSKATLFIFLIPKHPSAAEVHYNCLVVVGIDVDLLLKIFLDQFKRNRV